MRTRLYEYIGSQTNEIHFDYCLVNFSPRTIREVRQILKSASFLKKPCSIKWAGSKWRFEPKHDNWRKAFDSIKSYYTPK